MDDSSRHRWDRSQSRPDPGYRVDYASGPRHASRTGHESQTFDDRNRSHRSSSPNRNHAYYRRSSDYHDDRSGIHGARDDSRWDIEGRKRSESNIASSSPHYHTSSPSYHHKNRDIPNYHSDRYDSREESRDGRYSRRYDESPPLKKHRPSSHPHAPDSDQSMHWRSREIDHETERMNSSRHSSPPQLSAQRPYPDHRYPHSMDSIPVSGAMPVGQSTLSIFEGKFKSYDDFCLIIQHNEHMRLALKKKMEASKEQEKEEKGPGTSKTLSVEMFDENAALYSFYRQEYDSMHEREFFDLHSSQEWMQIRYHPRIRVDFSNETLEKAKNNSNQILTELQAGNLNPNYDASNHLLCLPDQYLRRIPGLQEKLNEMFKKTTDKNEQNDNNKMNEDKMNDDKMENDDHDDEDGHIEPYNDDVDLNEENELLTNKRSDLGGENQQSTSTDHESSKTKDIDMEGENQASKTAKSESTIKTESSIVTDQTNTNQIKNVDSKDNILSSDTHHESTVVQEEQKRENHQKSIKSDFKLPFDIPVDQVSLESILSFGSHVIAPRTVFVKGLKPHVNKKKFIEFLSFEDTKIERTLFSSFNAGNGFERIGWIVYATPEMANIAVKKSKTNDLFKSAHLSIHKARQVDLHVKLVPSVSLTLSRMRKDIFQAVKLIKKLDAAKLIKTFDFFEELASNESKWSDTPTKSMEQVDQSNTLSIESSKSTIQSESSISASTSTLSSTIPTLSSTTSSSTSDSFINHENDTCRKICDFLPISSSNPLFSFSVKKVLDIMIYYLRKVHNYSYYTGNEYKDEDSLILSSGDLILRAPSYFHTSDESDKWENTIDTRIEEKLQVDASAIDKKANQNESNSASILSFSSLIPSKDSFSIPKSLEDTIFDHLILKLEENRFSCSICQKLFRGAEFVQKHIQTKHPESLTSESIINEIYWNMYKNDPLRLRSSGLVELEMKQKKNQTSSTSSSHTKQSQNYQNRSNNNNNNQQRNQQHQNKRRNNNSNQNYKNQSKNSTQSNNLNNMNNNNMNNNMNNIQLMKRNYRDLDAPTQDTAPVDYATQLSQFRASLLARQNQK